MNTQWRAGRLLAVVALALAAGWPRAPQPSITTTACPDPVVIETGGETLVGAHPSPLRVLLCASAALEVITRFCPPIAPIHPGDHLRLRLDHLRCALHPTPLTAAHRLRLGERLDLNHATGSDLQAIPGIGPRTAEAIVQGRPWRRVDDLIQIRGIGPRRLARYRDHLRAGPPRPLVPSSLPAASSPRRP